MTIITIFLLAFLSISALAQDKIIKKSGAVIECKVTEIAADEVKYYYADNPKLIFGIDKVLVEKIEFSTGEVIVVEGNTFKNSEYYIGQSKRALKLNFTSPFTGSTELVYEQNIKPGRSWETALGIIGLGFDPQDYNPRGVFGKFAYKFMKDPDFYMQRMHYAHILKGGYIAPELALRYMSYDSEESWYGNSYERGTTRKEKFALAVMLKFGKQWVFDDAFLVDIFGGIGYGFGGDDYNTLSYGFIVGDEEVPVAFTGGIRIGWVFGK
jgi:hypothetical protein